jgi:hypothetical protein
VVHVTSGTGTAINNTATVTAASTNTNALNNTSTSNGTVTPTAIPTLSTWGLALFAALLAGCGAILYRRPNGYCAPGI